MNDQRLGRERRLRSDADFRRLFALRCSVSDGKLVVYVGHSAVSRTRMGLRVSRRQGGAVRRNRLKRVIREAFRLCRQEWPEGYDLLILPRNLGPASTRSVQASLRKLVPQAIARLERRAHEPEDSRS